MSEVGEGFSAVADDIRANCCGTFEVGVDDGSFGIGVWAYDEIADAKPDVVDGRGCQRVLP